MKFEFNFLIVEKGLCDGIAVVYLDVLYKLRRVVRLEIKVGPVLRRFGEVRW